MKELQKINEDHIVITKQKEQKKEGKYFGTIKFHKGHTLYKKNVETGEISKANFEPIEYNTNGNNNRKVIIEKGYIYASALNVKNAKKKFNK